MKMQISRRSNYTIFIMIYVFETEEMQSTHYVPAYFLLVELLILLITLFLAALGIYLSLKLPVLHAHYLIIYRNLCANFVSMAAGRVIMMLYEGDFIAVRSNVILLTMGSVCLMQYLLITVLAPVAIITERIFAVLYLKDYERKLRYSVPIIIVAVMQFSTWSITILNTLLLLPKTFIAVFAAFCVSYTALVYVILWYYNQRKLMTIGISGHSNSYSLSKRFQLVENIRVLKTILRLAILALFLIPLIVLIQYLVVGGHLQNCAYLYELLQTISITIVLFASIASFHEWRSHVSQRIYKRTTVAPNRYSSGDSRRVADQYFDQLGTAWT